jgi:hypothetical protein
VRKELLIFGILFIVGTLVLPFCIYVVGQNIIGEYSPDTGAFGLVTAIWSDLARFSIGAWILVLSPWGVIQLLRLATRLWRGGTRTAGPADS